MSFETADIERLREMADELPDAGEFSVFETIEEVLAFVIALARSEGRDEVADVELLAKAAKLSRDDRRRAAQVLRRLGYVAVADMLVYRRSRSQTQ